MKQIRIHGRGGMGTVKAAEIIVYSKVKAGAYGLSVPYFGFERQGAPVVAYVKLSDAPIRAKTQVDFPDCVVVMEPTLLKAVNVFEDMAGDGILVMNNKEKPDLDQLPAQVKKVGFVDATRISFDELGRAIPNTAMLGAFVRATGWIEGEWAREKIGAMFGPQNVKAFNRGWEETEIVQLQEAVQ